MQEKIVRRLRLRTLQLNELRWQAILDTARDAIICIDRRAASHALQPRGRGDLRLRGRRGDRAERPDADAGALPGRARRLPRHLSTTGVPKAIGRIREVQAQRKNGEIFPIELSVSEARVGDQVIYSAIIRDVSERRAMEVALEEARRLAEQRERLADIGAITARIVHDLGNPLAGLSMQAQLIQRRVTRDPDRPSRDLARAGRAHRVGGASPRRSDQGLPRLRAPAAARRCAPSRCRRSSQRVVDLWQPVAAAREITLDLDRRDPTFRRSRRTRTSSVACSTTS